MAGPSLVDGNSSITRVGWSGFSSDDDVDDDSDNNTQHLSVNVDCVRCYSDECLLCCLVVDLVFILLY